MRYIDLSQIEIPPEWLEKADKLRKEINSITDPADRAEYINKHPMWAELKNVLEKISHNKCWYSEAKASLSLYDVDHFRPKGEVRKCPLVDSVENENGYWWLSYDWTNYRLSGQICNRPNKDREDGKTKGKHNYFPLRKGSSIASEPDDDLTAEVKYLLDPTDEDDPSFITFDNTGEVYPSTTNDTWEYQRAIISIDLLNLNFERLTGKRREVWIYCTRLINQAQNIMAESNNITQAKLLYKLKEIRNQIKELLKPEAELSSVARACLLKSDYFWARNLVAN